MEQRMGTEASLLYAIYPYISRRISISSVLISLLIFVLGCVSIALGMDLNVSSDSLSMILLSLGTIMLLVALYRFFWKSKEWAYNETGSKVAEGSRYMDAGELQALLDVLEANEPKGLVFHLHKVCGNIRLDYIVSGDSQFVAVQLFKFVPYTYEPASRVYYYWGNDAAQITRHLQLKKN